MIALLGALGLALSPVNTSVQPVVAHTTQVAEDPTPQPTEDWKEKIKELMNNNLVGNIINWAIDAGLLAALGIVLTKYKKYKALSSTEICEDVKKTTNDAIKEILSKLDAEQLQKIMDSINKLDAEMDVLQKCFILAQDKSSAGRAALMEYLDAKIEEKKENKEVKEAINEQKETIQEQAQKEEETFEQVKDDYAPVE